MNLSYEPWQLIYCLLSLICFRIFAFYSISCSRPIRVSRIYVVEDPLNKLRFWVSLFVDFGFETLICFYVLFFLRLNFFALLDNSLLELITESRDANDWIEHLYVFIECWLYFVVFIDSLIHKLKFDLEILSLISWYLDLPLELWLKIIDLLLWLFIKAHHLLHFPSLLDEIDVPVNNVKLFFQFFDVTFQSTILITQSHNLQFVCVALP